MSFSVLISTSGQLPIEHLHLCERGTEELKKISVKTIADLASGIWSGLYSQKQMANVTEAMDQIMETMQSDGPDWYAYWESRDFHFTHLALTCSELESVTAKNPVCRISRENFGNAGGMLARAGYDTLGKLMDGLRDGIPEVRGMGRKKYGQFFAMMVWMIQDLRTGKTSLPELALKYPVAR